MGDHNFESKQKWQKVYKIPPPNPFILKGSQQKYLKF